MQGFNSPYVGESLNSICILCMKGDIFQRPHRKTTDDSLLEYVLKVIHNSFSIPTTIGSRIK